MSTQSDEDVVNETDQARAGARKINVLLYIDSLMIGGMHKQTYYLANYLDRNKFNVTVLTQNSNTGGLRQQFLNTGCILRDLGRNSTPGKKKRFSLSVSYRLARVIKELEIDVVYLNSAPSLIYMQFARLLLNRKPAQIGSFRAQTFWKGHLSAWYRPLDMLFARLLYRTSFRTIVNAESLGRHYATVLKVRSQNPLLVIENGSDFAYTVTASRQTIRHQLGIASSETAVIMSARLDPWKDFETLLRAAQLVVKSRQKIKIILMGDGPLREELRGLIKRLNLQGTVFMIGEQNEPLNHLNACDISVLSTHGEGFSNAIMESMFAEKPVIATDVGGNADVLGSSGECGYLVHHRAAEELAEKIILLSEDERLRRRLGENAKERILRLCCIDTYIKKYEKVFTEAANATFGFTN